MLALLALTPSGGSAGNTGYGNPPSNITSGNDLICAVNSVAGFLFGLFIALAVIFIIVAALFYLTAAGNQAQLDKAKNVLIYAIVAIVIALIAGGITSLVGDIGNIDTSGGYRPTCT